MNTKTLQAIRRHGESLLLAFPNAIETDPVTLCKKLRRIETSLRKPLLDDCNGDFLDNGDKAAAEIDRLCDKAKAKVVKLLGIDGEADKIFGLFVNRDPRGDALKLSEEWTRDFNHRQYVNHGKPIYTDMGGYGILAPDLTQEN